jgi:putative membrane protein
MKFITRILLTALALLVVAAYVPGIEVDGLYPALIAAIVLGLLNVIVKPILVILTFPITVITIGLFLLVINAALFWFAASFIDGFSVAGFWPALIGSVVVSLISTIGNRYL